MADFPIVVGPAGYIPQTPVSLNAQLIANVTAINPGYTANLPGGLIEDISSTDTYALIQCDSSVAEIINSLTPYGANEFLLGQLGNVYGVEAQPNYNTSVYLVFTGPPGYLISKGFLASDGTYQYTVQNGGIVGESGQTLPLLAIATQSGSWAVPANTVNQLATSVPTLVQSSGTPVTVNNPNTGTPASVTESVSSFRARVLQAGLATTQGMTRYMKTLLQNVPGVQARLVSAQLANNLWKIIVGGGDQYQVAYAIFNSLFDIASLTGSTMTVSGATNTNPAVITTELNHGYLTGQEVQFYNLLGAGWVELNGTYSYAATVLSETSFSIPIDATTMFGAYVAGSGYVLPNFRNLTPSIWDYPDTYLIPIVNPPQQTVSMTVLWNTFETSLYVDPVAIASAAGPALVDYVNSVPVGQPLNTLQMTSVFQTAVANILPLPLLTRLIFEVSINGVGTAPVTGTGEILGDPESYFYTTAALIYVNQG